MSEDDLKEVVEAFRVLKQWREESAAAERQAYLKTGTDSVPVAVH